MMGSLARTLMKKTIGIAGDATAEMTISILLSASFDTETGVTTPNTSVHTIGRAIVGVVAESELAKQRLQSTTHKAVISMLDYEASGSPELPETSDRILLNGKPWLVDKVVIGSMRHSVIFYVAEAETT